MSKQARKLLSGLGAVAAVFAVVVEVKAAETVEGFSRNAKSPISSGARHTCALDLAAGTVRCWGANWDTNDRVTGMLGDGADVEYRATPVQVLSAANGVAFGDVVQISAGYTHTCALREDRTVWCWGADNAGQIGNGAEDNATIKRFPVLVTGLTDVVDVSAGGNHTCAVRANGAAYCWGSDLEQQLGNGAGSSPSSVPMPVVGVGGVGTLTGVARVSAGANHTCAVMLDGKANCWGANGQGRLGVGGTSGLSYVHSPMAVVVGPSANNPARLTGVTQIDAGYKHTCAIAREGQVWCWGYAAKGALGNDETTGERPYAVEALDHLGNPLTGAVSLSVSATPIHSTAGGHACVTRTTSFSVTRSAWCWGDNMWLDKTARLGSDGTHSARAAGVRKGPGPQPALGWAEVGALHSCIGAPNALSCFGNNTVGQLGIGSADSNSHPRPAPVVGMNFAEEGG